MKGLKNIKIYFNNLDVIELPKKCCAMIDFKDIRKNMQILVKGMDVTQYECAEKVKIIIMKEWAEGTRINYNERNREVSLDTLGEFKGEVKNINLVERLVQYRDIAFIALKIKNKYYTISVQSQYEEGQNKYQRVNVRGNIVEIIIENI